MVYNISAAAILAVVLGTTTLAAPISLPSGLVEELEALQEPFEWLAADFMESYEVSTPLKLYEGLERAYSKPKHDLRKTFDEREGGVFFRRSDDPCTFLFQQLDTLGLPLAVMNALPTKEDCNSNEAFVHPTANLLTLLQGAIETARQQGPSSQVNITNEDIAKLRISALMPGLKELSWSLSQMSSVSSGTSTK